MDEIGSLEISWIQGFTNKKIAYVDNETVCYSCGSHICFLSLKTKTQNVLKSPGRGVGVLAANGNNGILAFSEQKVYPSIFIYSFPELCLKNELKGAAQLDFTSLTLSEVGSYLGCCSSLPEHTITIWSWENAEQICAHASGQEIVYLLFNPLNWLQLCALSTTGLSVWNIEKSGSFHSLKPSVINLPATDGSYVEHLDHSSQTDSEKIPCFSPEMPPSTIAGLQGDRTKLCTKARLTPTTCCWTAKSELYVGCAEGFLLLVDAESLKVSVLFNPTTSAIPELRQSSFKSLTLNTNGLIAIGEMGVVHCLQSKGTQISITQTWQLEGPVTNVMFSPDYETLLLSSDTGQIFTLNPTSDEIVKVLDVLSGNFVAAAFLQTDKKLCVSARESGDVQLWSTDGVCLGSLSLQAQVVSLACCPIAHYAVVGTASGYVLFIDLNRKHQPRLVHQVHLYNSAVDHLVQVSSIPRYTGQVSFDREGLYLFAGASDSHLYVLDGKASGRFSVMGYTVVPGPLLSLSTQNIRRSGQVKVLAMCGEQEGTKHNGCLLAVLTLPTNDLSGPDCSDRFGCLSSNILKVSKYTVPHPLESCVLGVDEIFAYCHKRKTLQRFQLPEDTDCLFSQEVVQLKPKQEEKGHPLGPASLVLSPHKGWLASVGRDGLLRIRETVSMERFIELQCHSYRLGGARSVSFSADGQTLLTVGFDGSLLCTDLRIKSSDADKMNEAALHKNMDFVLSEMLSRENDILTDLPEWGKESEKTEDTVVRSEAESVNVTEQDNGSDSSLPAPLSHLTWLESRRELVIKEEIEKHSEKKASMRKTLKELRDSIQEMMHENETVPDIERLELHEFNLDVKEQKRMEATVKQEVTRVRNEIEWEILAKSYLSILKRECWDSLKVKGKAVRAFHSEHEVKNYPLKERTQKEEDDLRRVQNMRKFEIAVCTQSKKKCSNTAEARTEEPGEEGQGAERAALTGSFPTQLESSNPYIYDQFSLQAIERRINQIILLQDLVYRIKTRFNADFETMHRQKVLELNRLKERNRDIREIMLELDISETLWEPSLTIGECPEKLFTVDNSEIKAEKYLTPEQREEEEERKRLDQQRQLASKEEDFREIALDCMMDGALEVKQDNILKLEIPPPEFVLTKPVNQWNEEEKKAHKEYEKKDKELTEEKEMYRKSLEKKKKKLQDATKQATERFDESLRQLFEKKIKSDMAIYWEELKITYLAYSVLDDEEMGNRELELKLKLEQMEAFKEETGEQLKRLEEETDLFSGHYDIQVLEDKALDKDFRKEFFNVPGHLVDHLYKLFKRRPRVQKMSPQADNNSNPFKEQGLCSSLAPDALEKMLKAMEDLDAPENMPEGLNRSVWEKFCLVRRTKVESEQKVKLNALTLTKMQAFLQKRRDEDMRVQQEIKTLSDKLERLHKERKHFMMDIMVHVLFKLDQVEVPVTDMTADYSNWLLYPRSLVEDVNKTIRTLGAQKIASMVEVKDSHKDTSQLQWKHKMIAMQLEDLNNKKRANQKLHLNKKQQDYLYSDDQDEYMSKQLSTLEETVAFQEQAHLQNVQHRKNKIKQLKKQAASKANMTEVVEHQLPEMQVAVSERRHLSEEIAFEEEEAAATEECYQDVAQRSKLKESALAQEEELTLLRAEVERLRMRNFPSL